MSLQNSKANILNEGLTEVVVKNSGYVATDYITVIANYFLARCQMPVGLLTNVLHTQTVKC